MTRRALRVATSVPDLSGIDCVGYLRVSTEKQAAEDRTSLADQRKAIIERARALGRTVGEWFVDDGFSGATVEGRPAFSALFAACEQHPRMKLTAGFVLCLNDSRFGRFDDPKEATYWHVHLKK